MHRWASAVLSLILVLLVAAPGSAQPPAGAAAERQVAFDLYDQHRMAEALPLLEKLAARHPDDIDVQERLGVCLTGVASGMKDPDERKKTVLRARAVLLHAKELGDNSNLLQTILGAIPEDGVLPAFSSRAEVDELMKAAEADFSRGAFDQALVKYVKALELDPTLYQAAVYAGDTCFNQKKYDAAGEWFAKAIHIDPDIETAYRYWGDALMVAGRTNEARTKFIEAVIADPYDRTARIGLTQWADNYSVQLHTLQLKQLAAVTNDGGKMTITLDPTALGKPDSSFSMASILYGGARAKWQGERFKQEFPNEPAYRHSLKEETEALDLVATVVARERASDKAPAGGAALDPELAELVRIRDAGLLEAYILLFRPDAGIVRDYADYRAANREKLLRFMDEFVVPRLPQKH